MTAATLTGWSGAPWPCPAHRAWPRRPGPRAVFTEGASFPTPPNYHLRYPKYHLIQTIRPLIELHWGVLVFVCFSCLCLCLFFVFFDWFLLCVCVCCFFIGVVRRLCICSVGSDGPEGAQMPFAQGLRAQRPSIYIYIHLCICIMWYMYVIVLGPDSY